MSNVMVYITASGVKEARTIGSRLVKEGLAGCVNIVRGMESVYKWKGKIEKSRESILIVKTKNSLSGKVIKRVKEIHSYSCPAILVIPVRGGNPDYLKWLDQQTS